MDVVHLAGRGKACMSFSDVPSSSLLWVPPRPSMAAQMDGMLAGKCQPLLSQPGRVKAQGEANFTSPSNYSGFYRSKLKTESINNQDLCLNSCISAYF